MLPPETRSVRLAVLDTNAGEGVKKTLHHSSCGNRSHWIDAVVLEPQGRSGIECLVGHPAEIRAPEPGKQKHDRRVADLVLSRLVEERFLAIWPRKELLDLPALSYRGTDSRGVRLRVKIQNVLQAFP
jgi:hypothetical protein